jgi:hypothetical protein
MQHTPVIVGAFVAAVIAGLLVRFMQKEHFSQKSVGMPIDFSQPALPYDGTSTLLGSEAKPISQKPYDMADDTQLFFLAKNKVGSDCCPSVYSTGGGCVCVSDAEAEAMGSRGGNRARGS